MAKELNFDPFPFFEDPHKQTIVSAFFSIPFEPTSETKFVSLPDGDKLALEVTTPRGWQPTDPTVILVHGLCGSHQSPYLVRMVKKLEPLGIRGVRFNMRCCGSGRGHAKQIYHSGRSEDVFAAVKAIQAEAPESPLILIGFSLGGNVVLKLAGELGTLGSAFLKKVIAVSPPADLFSSVLLLGDVENAMYERYFCRMLRKEVYYLHKRFKDLPSVHLPRDMKLYEFDQLYTAPRCGFVSARDYYDKCSAVNVASEIALPTKVLLSEDDPIVSSSSLDKVNLPSNVDVYKTKKGGHMGYLGHPRGDKGVYWLDAVLIDWILEN